jgi:hypothetical protein
MYYKNLKYALLNASQIAANIRTCTYFAQLDWVAA